MGTIRERTMSTYSYNHQQKERVQLAYDGLVSGVGEEAKDPLATIEQRYARGETDEFLKPIIVDKEGCLQDNDTLMFFNFRSDR